MINMSEDKEEKKGLYLNPSQYDRLSKDYPSIFPPRENIEVKFIPYFTCLECRAIIRADELSANPKDWNLQTISKLRCPYCKEIGQTDQWIQICPFETYQIEIDESRCILPMKMSNYATYGHNGSWFCEFHGKIEKCPIYAVFSGEKHRKEITKLEEVIFPKFLRCIDCIEYKEEDHICRAKKPYHTHNEGIFRNCKDGKVSKEKILDFIGKLDTFDEELKEMISTYYIQVYIDVYGE
jgi:hypothetical protein